MTSVIWRRHIAHWVWNWFSDHINLLGDATMLCLNNTIEVRVWWWVQRGVNIILWMHQSQKQITQRLQSLARCGTFPSFSWCPLKVGSGLGWRTKKLQTRRPIGRQQNFELKEFMLRLGSKVRKTRSDHSIASLFRHFLLVFTHKHTHRLWNQFSSSSQVLNLKSKSTKWCLGPQVSWTWTLMATHP
jgi:hypothetical protein